MNNFSKQFLVPAFVGIFSGTSIGMMLVAPLVASVGAFVVGFVGLVLTLLLVDLV